MDVDVSMQQTQVISSGILRRLASIFAHLNRSIDASGRATCVACSHRGVNAGGDVNYFTHSRREAWQLCLLALKRLGRNLMQSPEIGSFAHNVYDVVNAALWALAAATALWFLLSIPTMMQARRAADRLTILELADESRTYCEKWGMKAGTAEHATCVQDLQEIRDKHKTRILADIEVL
jgi:hypothetical protein